MVHITLTNYRINFGYSNDNRLGISINDGRNLNHYLFEIDGPYQGPLPPRTLTVPTPQNPHSGPPSLTTPSTGPPRPLTPNNLSSSFYEERSFPVLLESERSPGINKGLIHIPEEEEMIAEQSKTLSVQIKIQDETLPNYRNPSLIDLLTVTDYEGHISLSDFQVPLRTLWRITQRIDPSTTTLDTVYLKTSPNQGAAVPAFLDNNAQTHIESAPWE